MEAADLLLTLAEVSVAFVGFSAVVVALRERRAAAWSLFESVAIRVPIQMGLAALFFSVLPLLLAQAPLPESIVWRVSSGTLALYLLGSAVHFRRVRQRIAREEPERLRPIVHFARLGAASLVLLVQLFNVGTVAVSWPYLLGVSWLLAFGGLFFLRLFAVLEPHEGDRG